MIGRDLHALLPGPYPEPSTSAILSALGREGGWAGDISTTTPAGEPIVLRCAALAFKDGAGTPYQYVAVATKLDPC